MTECFAHGYALLIGVGRSAYPAWSLPVTVKDVTALQAILENPALCGYSAANIRVLTDDRATRQAILEGLDWLRQQATRDPDATIVVYYSGHGWLDQAQDRYYLVQHDIKPFNLAGSALAAEEFTAALRQIPAERLLVVIDSCHAEGMATAKSGEAGLELPANFVAVAPSKGLFDPLSQQKGRAVFTSCAGTQKSWIHKDQQLSIFTHHLIEALQGSANHPGETAVKVSHLMNHLGETVSASAMAECQAAQDPQFDFKTEDFAIALLQGGKGLSAGRNTGQQHRLKDRCDTLQSEWQLRSEKVKRLREALAIEASVAVKFQLEKQLADEESQLSRLSNELDRIETNLQGSHSFVHSTSASSSKTMIIPEPFTTIPVTAGILTNIASDILKYHAQSLDGTLAGQVLKWTGLIEPNLYDQLREVLWKALDLYFITYPERNLLGIDNFFLDTEVSRQIGGYILERQSIDWLKMQQAFEQHVGIHDGSREQIQAQGLAPQQIIEDFVGCYRQVLREQLSLPQFVVLLELLNQNEALVAEIRNSEQRMRQYITELLANQLSPHSLNAAYQQGQQQLAIALTDEMNATGLVGSDQSLQVIQARLQPTPALFERGLCKGRLLSAKPHQYFVSHGFTPDLLTDWRQALEKSLAQVSGDHSMLQPYFSGDALLAGFRLCGICEQIYTSRFSMFLLPPSQDRNVYLELGIAIGLGAPFFLIQHYEAKIPRVLEGLSRYAKGGLFRTMRRELAGQIEEYDFGVVHFIADLPQAGSQSKYLISAGELIDDEDFEGEVVEALQDSHPKLEAISLTNRLKNAESSGWMLEQLVKSIQESRFAIYRVDEECSPTTFLALGISIGLNRPFLMVHRSNQKVPLDLRGMGMYQFPNFVALRKEVIARHQEFFNRYTR